MNIVVINHYAGSSIHGMEYRPFYLAGEWVKMGHQVSIVAASYSHLRSKKPDGRGYIMKESLCGIQYYWLRTPRYEGNGIKRVLNMFTFSAMLYINRSRLLKECKPDLIIASSPHPFIMYGLYKIARSANAKLFFEVRDLWPLTLIELGGLSPNHPFIMLMQRIENMAYRKSDRIISLLPKAADYMREHGMEPSKFVYIPNGISVMEWQNNESGLPDNHASVLKKLRDAGQFMVGYAGAHGLANALHALIESFVSLKDRPVTLVLTGQGAEKKELQRSVARMGLNNNVVFLPPVPKSSVPSLLSAMDLLYIGLKNEALFRFGISPNKLLDYMMSAKPVVHAIDAGNDMVAESGCGISVPPENPEAIATAILKIMSMTEGERRAMGLRGKKYVLDNHDYAVLADKFLKAYDEQLLH